MPAAGGAGEDLVVVCNEQLCNSQTHVAYRQDAHACSKRRHDGLRMQMPQSQWESKVEVMRCIETYVRMYCASFRPASHLTSIPAYSVDGLVMMNVQYKHAALSMKETLKKENTPGQTVVCGSMFRW